jgi:GNAT superfamily N-acetyltransferase
MANLNSILLLPRHVTPTETNLPLLKSIQKLLNDSYTETYCAHPEYFGDSHVRVADPAQIADIIGDQGFTVILVNTTKKESGEEHAQVMATGSVKDFGDGDLESYAQWSKNLSGSQWAAGDTSKVQKKSKAEDATTGAKLELTAFAVSPDFQAAGLGVQILQDIEWIIASGVHKSNHLGKDQIVSGLGKMESTTYSNWNGYSVDDLRKSSLSSELQHKPLLVLIVIRELGTEGYYQRRGFKPVWSGPIPIGMWDCKQECTMVYMEKVI